MKFTFEIEGLEKLQKRSAEIQKEAERQMAIALLDSGFKIQRDAQASIRQGNKTGALYRRRSKTHRASAPGEAPALDTGVLANSISVQTQASTVNIFTRLKYAAWLEYGTRLIRPRPFMFPAFERNKKWIKERIESAIQKAIRK